MPYQFSKEERQRGGRNSQKKHSKNGTRYKFTRTDCQRGYDMTLLRYPMLQAKLLAKIKGLPKYDGWKYFPGNPPPKEER